VQNVHLRPAFLLAQATARHLLERGSPGSIVLIGSLTSFRGIAGVVPYATAKSGIVGLAHGLAVEWGPAGIRVNVIAPGFFPTEMTRDIEELPTRQRLYERIPMGRLGEPADLAGTAVYLASDASAYVTGQVLTVDGGWTAA
jgi:2-deoxy-D-gluconate 3-dehydrogenase